MTSVYFENQEDSDLSSHDSRDDVSETSSRAKRAPRKCKYLWRCVGYPGKLYRRIEWWFIEYMLSSKVINQERITLKLHMKYRNNPSLGLLYYFHDLAKYEGRDVVPGKGVEVGKPDLSRIKELLIGGADVHACDDTGQNLMHEIARYHGAEVCIFFLDYSVNINLEDDYSVTPLHLAAAHNNAPIVELLVTNGGKLEATTFYLLQTPLHYAARYDSPSSIVKLVEMGAEIEARDYRGRTPLLLAAELGRVRAGYALIDCSARVYALDFTGMYALSAMVQKCTPLAIKGLDHCVKEDLRNRKQFFYLQFLEPRTLCHDECAKITFSVLEEAVRSSNLDIIRHPVIQELIDVKWNQFGRTGYLKEVFMYVLVLISLSIVCVLNPINPASYHTDEDDGISYTGFISRIANEAFSCILFVYQVVDEFIEYRTNTSRHRKFVKQRLAQLEMELKYLELLSKEEKEYLMNEQKNTQASTSAYRRDYWNVFDWVSQLLMFTTILTYSITKYVRPYSGSFQSSVTRGQLLSITLIIFWLKLFKYVRVLKTLGPFCIIIAALPKDFAKIGLVYMILYIPVVCVFFHFYSGDYNDMAHIFDNEDFNANKYGSLEQSAFTVFLFTIVDDYGYETLVLISDARGIPKWFTQVFVAYWLIVSSILLLNIFIALMADTFSRVYENAAVVARLEQAGLIVSIENKLGSYWREQHLKDLSDNYSPTCVFFDDDDVDGNEMMAVRVGAYKAHYWTWTEFHKGSKPGGLDFCPGQSVLNVTTHDQVNRTLEPVVFNINRDPGERYVLKGGEYNKAMKIISPIVVEHKETLEKGEPSLNYCDNAVMNWAPPGCEELNYCLPVPQSKPKLCYWDH